MAMLLQSQRPPKPLWREYGEALFVALILALVIRTFVVQAFKIPSESMVKTLLVGDHLLASKFSYGVKIPFTHSYIYKGSDPVKGDIIIFEYPNDPSVDYIKRIIGTPGDTIEVRNKQLFRNGEPVKESYIRFTEPDSRGATISARSPYPQTSILSWATTATTRWIRASGASWTAAPYAPKPGASIGRGAVWVISAGIASARPCNSIWRYILLAGADGICPVRLTARFLRRG